MVRKTANRKVTREEVAQRAGTSVAVVSYVVNNGPRPVAESTRQRVLEAIRHMGYQPNSIARALASGTTRTFGAVVPNIANPFLAAMAHELLQESMRYGHVMLLGDAGANCHQEREVVLSLLNRQVDGLIYISVDRHPCIDIIRDSGTPLVLLEGNNPDQGVSVLRVNERQAANDVTTHLLSHGYQQVGVISGPPELQNSRDRLDGWQDAMLSHQRVIYPQWIIPGDYTREGGYQATRQLLALQTRPQALFVCNEPMAIGCLRALAEQGISVPDQLALVCFNGTEQAAFNLPSLTCVRQPIAESAVVALRMLREWQGGGTLYHIRHTLEIGHSCGCR